MIHLRAIHLFFAFLFLLLFLVPAYSQTEEEQVATDEPQYGSVEERRLLVALQQERKSFEEERLALDDKKKELKRLETEVDKKLDQLNGLRTRIEQLLEEKDAAELKRIQDLSKMYEKMSAEKAAKIFTALEQSLAIAILEKMKTKAAAKILNNMDRERAASITTGFSTLETQ